MPEVTVRVDRKTKARLEKLAMRRAEHESRLVAEAIRSYVDMNEWQIKRIKQAIKEADAGNFATDAEVKALLRKVEKACELDGPVAALQELDDASEFIGIESPNMR